MGEGIDPTLDTLNYVGSENLIGFWPFNEGADSSATDYSGSGFDGKIVGASWVNVDSKLPPQEDVDALAEAGDQKYSSQREFFIPPVFIFCSGR